ncbi:Mitochondrial distribution and morphology protein 31, mitochondrial precursor [Dinochytrium kinnereticum]|nr:Mitochondrial distribution and morphology protein 31, mitochondrial precursor [Dinochytrium kinnereticum]
MFCRCRRSFSAKSQREARETASAFVPTPDEIVANAQGLFQKVRLRIRLLLLGQYNYRRSLRVDDVLALFSWLSVGTSLFILAGTTTAVSLVVSVANSIKFQEYFAESISRYLTKETGFEIGFESAIVPRWKEGTIRLTNVSIVCTGDTWLRRKEREKLERGGGALFPDEVDLNWTYWDLNIDSVDVTLSLWRWLEGRGLIMECTMKGVRGVVDRRHIIWDPSWVPSRRHSLPGDFEMDKFVVEDLLLTILNPNFRPYAVSVFRGELPLFRKQWLLYDIMCANSIVGMFDNCLFSVHKPQENDVLAMSVGKASTDNVRTINWRSEEEVNASSQMKWAKMRHLKINNFPIDHLNAGVTGPFGWITSGTLDVDFHLFIPKTNDNDLLQLLMSEFEEIKGSAMGTIEELILRHPESEGRRGGVVATSALASNINRILRYRDRSLNVPQAGATPFEPRFYPPRYSMSLAGSSRVANGAVMTQDEGDTPSLLMHCSVSLNDLRASLPLATSHISYMNNAIMRPVVAYMNANRTRIPLSFWAKMDLGNFDGAWTFHSAGMVDLFGEEIGRAVTDLVLNERERGHHLKRVGLWSIQSVTKNIVAAVDYARGTRGWEHWTMHFGREHTHGCHPPGNMKVEEIKVEEADKAPALSKPLGRPREEFVPTAPVHDMGKECEKTLGLVGNVYGKQGDDTASVAKRRRGDHSSIFKDVEVPLFSETIQKEKLISSSTGKTLTIKISAEAQGFFHAENNWTCYRRNYFKISTGFQITDADGKPISDFEPFQVHESLSESGPPSLADVQSFRMGITSRALGGGPFAANIDIIQHTAKRDRGPQRTPDMCTVIPGANLSKPIPDETVATFERVQFKSSTSLAKSTLYPDVASQQFAQVVLEVWAVCKNGGKVLVAVLESCPLVIRSRSPSHYEGGAGGGLSPMQRARIACGKGAAAGKKIARGISATKVVTNISVPIENLRKDTYWAIGAAKKSDIDMKSVDADVSAFLSSNASTLLPVGGPYSSLKMAPVPSPTLPISSMNMESVAIPTFTPSTQAVGSIIQCSSTDAVNPLLDLSSSILPLTHLPPRSQSDGPVPVTSSTGGYPSLNAFSLINPLTMLASQGGPSSLDAAIMPPVSHDSVASIASNSLLPLLLSTNTVPSIPIPQPVASNLTALSQQYFESTLHRHLMFGQGGGMAPLFSQGVVHHTSTPAPQQRLQQQALTVPSLFSPAMQSWCPSLMTVNSGEAAFPSMMVPTPGMMTPFLDQQNQPQIPPMVPAWPLFTLDNTMLPVLGNIRRDPGSPFYESWVATSLKLKIGIGILNGSHVTKKNKA